MNNAKTSIVLSAVSRTRPLGAASVAQASNENDGGTKPAAMYKPGSMVGVNPAYHPGDVWQSRQCDPWLQCPRHPTAPSHKHKVPVTRPAAKEELPGWYSRGLSMELKVARGPPK